MSYHTNTFSPSLPTASQSGSVGGVQSASYADTGTTPGSGEQLLRDGSTFYDTTLADIESYQRRDVSEQIIRYHQIFGGSDNTQQNQTASSQALNYAQAPTIQQATVQMISAIPFVLEVRGQIGLFGAENAYLRVDVDTKEVYNIAKGLKVGVYDTAYINPSIENEIIDDYQPAYIAYSCEDAAEDPDFIGKSVLLQSLNNNATYSVPLSDVYLAYCNQGPSPSQAQKGTCSGVVIVISNNPINIARLPDNCYQNAMITDVFPTLQDPKLSIRLENIGTGNIYIDTWLETMLYKRDQQMWGFDTLFIAPKDTFYLGVHARNTRRLDYNLRLHIGEELIPSAEVNRSALVEDSTLTYY